MSNVIDVNFGTPDERYTAMRTDADMERGLAFLLQGDFGGSPVTPEDLPNVKFEKDYFGMVSEDCHTHLRSVLRGELADHKPVLEAATVNSKITPIASRLTTAIGRFTQMMKVASTRDTRARIDLEDYAYEVAMDMGAFWSRPELLIPITAANPGKVATSGLRRRLMRTKVSTTDSITVDVPPKGPEYVLKQMKAWHDEVRGKTPSASTGPERHHPKPIGWRIAGEAIRTYMLADIEDNYSLIAHQLQYPAKRA